MALAKKLAERDSDSMDQHLPHCRFCGAGLSETFADLGMMPPANYYRRPEDRFSAEPFYPLHAYVCGACFLVQLEAMQTPEQLFGDYAYFSSYAESWLRHAENYADTMVARLGLGPDSLVVEVASNDGYLLQYFRKQDVPVLGIEPAANVAKAAERKGIPTRVEFFGQAAARGLVSRGEGADLLIGNNVLAHVPDLNDFVAGLSIALKPDGVLTMEFPHLLRLMTENQFDTIYHEHFSYFSVLTARRVFAGHGLEIFDIDELPTHGGSVRVYVGHRGRHAQSPMVDQLLLRERRAGLDKVESYRGFAEQVRSAKRGLLQFLIDAKSAGHSIVGYGAPAKGNTLLNYCGVRTDFLDYTVDRNPQKQGLLLPGTGIPVHAPERIFETRPDYVLILPWNLKDEIIESMAGIRDWGGRFVTPIPEITVHP